MVKADAGNDRQERLFDDIGGIEPAAQPHLQHHKIDLFAAEIFERDGGDQTEFGRRGVQRFGGGADACGDVGKRVGRDVLTIHADALGKIDHVGRGVQTHAVAGGTQDGI